MNGKVLKIVSNDLYGNVDDRSVVVFACFCHTKYMNNYVVFAVKGEYGKKKICYGSVHLKNNSLVIFSVKDNIRKYIEDFLSEYLLDRLDNFTILNIDNVEKVELVSCSDMDCDNLLELEEKSIPKLDDIEDNNVSKKPIFLYFLLICLVLFGIGLTIIYFNPKLVGIKYRQLVCNNSLYDKELMLNYDVEYDIKFDDKDKLNSIDVNKIYIFLESDVYYDFKDNNRFEEYFNNGEAYKFIDSELKFKVMYQKTSVIDSYDEMLVYMKKEGFSCIEKEYEK